MTDKILAGFEAQSPGGCAPDEDSSGFWSDEAVEEREACRIGPILAYGFPVWVSGPGAVSAVPYRFFDKPVMEKSVETLKKRRLHE